MEEGQVTVDGVSHPIPQPFIVFATQNPTGAAGTQLLPDSQMDRFTVRLSIGYPAPGDEREILLGRQKGNPLLQVRQVVTREELLTMQQEAANVYLKPELADYIVSLVGKTRTDPLIARGASPRATLSLGAWQRPSPTSREEIMSSPRTFRTSSSRPARTDCFFPLRRTQRESAPKSCWIEF